MEKKSLVEKTNPWFNLPTITAFDKGSSTCRAKYKNEIRKEKSNKNLVKKCTPSVLISSLLNYICYLSAKDSEEKQNLYSLLCNILQKMNVIDPSSKVKSLEFAEGRYMDAVYQLINVARSITGSNNASYVPRPIWSYVCLYQDQFIETGFIAGGGFGSVYKARHKLDEVEYAIKKIIVKPGKIKTILNYLEEVKTLAKLNHSNIVSYKQAWIEPYSLPYLPQLPPSTNLVRNNSHRSRVKSRHDSNLKIRSCRTFSKNQFSSSSDKILIQESIKTNESCSDSISFREESGNKPEKSVEKNNSDNVVLEDSLSSETESHLTSFNDEKEAHDLQNDYKTNFTSEISTDESSNESLENIKICQYSAKKNFYTILYIQMALCEKTLRQWLDERTEPTPVSLMTDLATQILQGLHYIHSQKIVHHDIKPSNIFISTSGKLRVQLGDFGLACPLQKESHDSIFGTCMYAAPEQLNGECNPKSDIYSLGIVFLELLVPMKTISECIKMIDSLKSNKIPIELASSHPKWIDIIMKLIQKNPLERPSSMELLEDLRIDKDLTIMKLESENKRLRYENDRKDQTIRELEIYVKNLQDQLVNLSVENIG